MESRLEVMDAFEFLDSLPDESADLILTDPPYESLRKWEGIGTTARMGLGRPGSRASDPDKFFDTMPNEYILPMLQQFYRILKQNRHAYIMCDDETLPYMFAALGRGFYCPKCQWFTGPHDPARFSNVKLLVWDKCRPGMGYHYRAQHEYIVMLDKGKNRRLNDLSVADVLRFPPDKPRLYPCQKPLALFELLIQQSTEPGEVVVDPFVGSGTTALACAKLGRVYLTCDVSAKAIQIARQRLAHLALTLPNATSAEDVPNHDT